MRPTWSLTSEEKLNLIAEVTSDEQSATANYSALLENLLADSDPAVRVAALGALWDYPEPRFVALFMERATQDESAEVRVAALDALGRAVYEGDLSDEPEVSDGRWNEIQAPVRAAGKRALDFLLQTFHDSERPLSERCHALEAASFGHTPDVAQAIALASQMGESAYQVSAIFAMGRHGELVWRPYVLQALERADLALRTEAVRAAGEMGISAATPALTQWARNAETPRQLRLWSIFALGQIGSPEVHALLERLTLDTDLEVADTARAALDEWELVQEFGFEDDEWL